MDLVRDWNRKNIDNYVEIYIKSEIKEIIRQKKKNLLFIKKKFSWTWYQPEFPKKPDIVLKNNFKMNINELSEKLMDKIQKLIRFLINFFRYSYIH